MIDPQEEQRAQISLLKAELSTLKSTLLELKRSHDADRSMYEEEICIRDNYIGALVVDKARLEGELQVAVGQLTTKDQDNAYEISH